MAFVEDLSPFFNTAEFAVEATLDGAGVVGIFDKAYARAGVGELGMATVQPAFTLPTVSVPVDPVGKAMVIGAVSYTVAEHQPGSTGVSVLFLERAL